MADGRVGRMSRPHYRTRVLSAGGLLLATALLAGCGGLADIGHAAEGGSRYQPIRYGPADVPGGQPERGRRAMRSTYGCGACHVIPGVTGAEGMVGPPLTSWARRVYVAGSLPNTPESLILWIRHPQAVEPGTAMPDLGVSEEDARDIAAYLYTLK